MIKHINNERGLALLVSIMAIIVVGGLLIGTVTAARLENRQAHNTGEMAQAFAVSELGLNETIADFSGGWNALGITETAAITGASVAGAGSYSGTVTRLNQSWYLVDITGASAGGRARQRQVSFVNMGSRDIFITAAALPPEPAPMTTRRVVPALPSSGQTPADDE